MENKKEKLISAKEIAKGKNLYNCWVSLSCLGLGHESYELYIIASDRVEAWSIFIQKVKNRFGSLKNIIRMSVIEQRGNFRANTIKEVEKYNGWNKEENGKLKGDQK